MDQNAIDAGIVARVATAGDTGCAGQHDGRGLCRRASRRARFLCSAATARSRGRPGYGSRHPDQVGRDGLALRKAGSQARRAQSGNPRQSTSGAAPGCGEGGFRRHLRRRTAGRRSRAGLFLGLVGALLRVAIRAHGRRSHPRGKRQAAVPEPLHPSIRRRSNWSQSRRALPSMEPGQAQRGAGHRDPRGRTDRIASWCGIAIWS